MTTNKKGNVFAIIAGICYVVLFISGLMEYIVSINTYQSFSAESLFLYILITILPYVFLTVSLFLRNKISVLLALVPVMFIDVYRLASVSSGIAEYLLRLFAYVAVIVLIILAMKKKKIVAILWFIPCTLFFIGIIIALITYIPFIIKYSEYVGSWEYVIYFVQLFVELAGLLFIGLWLGKDVRAVEASTGDEYTTFDPQRVYAKQEISGEGMADRENVIVKGVIGKNTFAEALIPGGIMLLYLSIILMLIACSEQCWEEWYDCGESYFVFFFKHFFSFKSFHGYTFLHGVGALVLGIILKSGTEKHEITVTDQRILGKTSHGRGVSIPLNQMRAISKCPFKGITVASVGAKERFHCIENREEVMKGIAYLMTDFSQKMASQPGTIGDSEVEQLKRFKELLDSGIITQEEFDAKKKQILGL